MQSTILDTREYYQLSTSEFEKDRESSPDDTFEVDCILDKKILRGENMKNRLFYLVRWKNYNELEDTWEPSSHLSGCRELVREFNENRKLNCTANDMDISNPRQRKKTSRLLELEEYEVAEILINIPVYTHLKRKKNKICVI